MALNKQVTHIQLLVTHSAIDLTLCSGVDLIDLIY